MIRILTALGMIFIPYLIGCVLFNFPEYKKLDKFDIFLIWVIGAFTIFCISTLIGALWILSGIFI